MIILHHFRGITTFTVYWCTKHASTSNHSICAFWTSRRHSTLSPTISSGWLWWTWNILCTCLLAKLYSKQLAKVKVAGTLSEYFCDKKGFWQGRVLSPYLFNILVEMVIRETLDGFQGGLLIGGWIVINLRYAEEIILLATLEAELQDQKGWLLLNLCPDAVPNDN